MTVNVREDEIVDKLYGSSKDWVSVEVELDKYLDPSTLFHITESQAGDRFYLRLNDNQSSYFGYHAIRKFENDFENKQSIFKEWETLKKDIELIHPDSEKHHLRLCGGFQFSKHKSDDEWRAYGLNHFVLPEVLISTENDRTFVTYTTEKKTFDMDSFKSLVNDLAQANNDTEDDYLGNVIRMEDIYLDEWRDLVQEAIDSIDYSKKIVLARRRLIKFDKEISIPYILTRALKNEKNSYIFLLESNESVFFSQTPEQLLKVENQVLSTKAVAGTIKRSQNEQEDEANLQAFLNDKKNLNEHQIVVESILNDIQPYVEDVYYNETPNILKNDHLYHLFTKIQGNLKEQSYIGLIDRMHPTPALGGYPKDEALEFIEQKEFGTRGLYGSPVGYIDVYDDCEFIVAIRSMLIKGDQATLFAGCGIVKDSDPDSEIAETAVKFSPMMNALGVDKHE